MSNHIFRVLCLAIAVSAHFIASLQFHLDNEVIKLPAEWQGQFYILLVISLIFSVGLLLFHRNSYFFWTSIAVKVVILILFGLTFGSNLTIESILFGALILEIFAYGTLVKGSVLAVLLVALLLKMHFPIVGWNRVIPSPALPDQISFAILALIITLLSALIRFLLDNQVFKTELNQYLNDTTLQLAQANLQLQEYAVLVEREAKIIERKRLAGEMHDTIAYTFTNLLMMLEVAIALTAGDRAELKAHLEQARDLTKKGLAEARNALQALRPVYMKEESGLTAIYHLVQTFTQATRIKVDLNLGDAPPHFGAEADWAVYHLVQEGITNALRHGRANLIEISFYREGDGIRIRLKDNGCGLAKAPKEGFGLTGMRERIEKLEGKLDCSSEPGKYFLLSAWVPLKEGEAYEQN
jgi:signal transduction histidine kinase